MEFLSAAAAAWTVEDDIVLKSAIEAGASLESLAKEAICFSHKFTLKELQDRWYSLLYETSAQACTRMAEYETELLTSNPAKAHKRFNSKAFSLYKRKRGSVKEQYFTKRKRVCDEPCLSADFGSCIRKDGGGCTCGCQLKCSEGHQLAHTVDPSGGDASGYGCVGPYLPCSDTTNCGSHIDHMQEKHNVTDVSGVDTIPASEEVFYPGCNVKCILNTKDSEIPLNDHIPIPGHNPIASMSTSVQAEGSDSENSVPDYFDLEALILDQDLIPFDQESELIQPEVSRFHSPESRKDLIRLEKGACSYMNRSIMSKSAFAIIYGQHLRYYIRDTEVTLGRETEKVHVDIDLGKEGKANKISRRQAVIKMDDGGSFYMKNTGKCSIFVNSKEVPCNKRILLTSDSLIAIRNMQFIFHVNHNAVRQHIVRARRGSSQGNNTTFDWNQNA